MHLVHHLCRHEHELAAELLQHAPLKWGAQHQNEWLDLCAIRADFLLLVEDNRAVLPVPAVIIDKGLDCFRINGSELVLLQILA